MLKRWYFIALAAAVIGWSLYTRFWVQSPVPKDVISIEAGTVIIENQSEREWRNVVITVNDHFHAGARTLAAGGRLNAPLSQFATGHGQKFDRSRYGVVKIQVKATDADGTPVQHEWLARTTT
jgi:hypothetical protein